MAAAARASDLYISCRLSRSSCVSSPDTLFRARRRSRPSSRAPRQRIVPARLRDTLERKVLATSRSSIRACGRFRVNASRQRTGYQVVLRLIPKHRRRLRGSDCPTLWRKFSARVRASSSSPGRPRRESPARSPRSSTHQSGHRAAHHDDRRPDRASSRAEERSCQSA